jgi:predicted Zn-dependent protease
MRHMLLCAILFATLGAISGGAAALPAQENVVSRAMHDEMQRSMQKLELEQLDKPYFISYRVVETDAKETSATLGSLLSRSERRMRFLTVNVRVGDYSFDNSNFLSTGSFGGPGMARMFLGTVQLPLDNDYAELRRQMWLATDGAYKKALEDLAGKRAALEEKNRTANLPDFSKASPVSVTDMAPPAEVSLDDAARLSRELSAVFLEIPQIQTSRVRFAEENKLEYYLNSEGTTVTRMAPSITVRITAATQAADGMPLDDFVAAYGRSMKDLPPETALLAQTRELGQRLVKLQAAPVAEQYSGPVLFEGQAAASVFASHFADLLPAAPQMVSGGNPALAGLLGGQGSNGSSPFVNRKGARVLPEFLNVADDPTAAREGDELLLGGYKVDEEGTLSKRTVVVQQGILKTVLTSRAPVRGVLESTGNMRESGVAPSNVIVTADQTKTPDELKKQLIELAKDRGNEYGVVVRRLSGRSAILAYRVYADGHEEQMRNADISGLEISSFKDILAASSQSFVLTEPAPRRRASLLDVLNSIVPSFGGDPLVSYVVPGLLFEDVTIERPSGQVQKPPVLKSPIAEK